jgi:hypothetical protein
MYVSLFGRGGKVKVAVILNFRKINLSETWQWFIVKRERVSDRPSRIRSSQPAGSKVLGFLIPCKHSEVKGVCPESDPEPREY